MIYRCGGTGGRDATATATATVTAMADESTRMTVAMALGTAEGPD